MILALRAELNPDTLLLLDEAYVEFIDPAKAPPSGVLPGTLRLRTLSKAYALARACGWAMHWARPA